MFEAANVDNGKELHFNDFLAATLGRRDLDERRLTLAFDRLDFDHSGKIDGGLLVSSSSKVRIASYPALVLFAVLHVYTCLWTMYF